MLKPARQNLTIGGRQLQVPGRLANIAVVGIPDFGSCFDILGESFVVANQSRLTVDRSKAHRYSLPNGRTKKFIGTVTAYWRFGNEEKPIRRTFYVLPGCVHQVLLGREFLRTTETFSKYTSRIKEVFVKTISSLPRLLLVDHLNSVAGSTERMLGLINGRPVPGFADTCSDISIVRRDVAHRLGLKILDGPEHRNEVVFIDGSTSFTTGIVKDVTWCFSASLSPKDTRRLNFHIMDDIPCAVILDKWLLWDNRAFVDYKDTFFDIEDCQTSNENPVCLIQLKKKKGKNVAADPADEEAARRALEEDRIAELDPAWRAAARAAEERRRQLWESGQATSTTQTGQSTSTEDSRSSGSNHQLGTNTNSSQMQTAGARGREGGRRRIRKRLQA
ncbi:hypothetical protein GQ53DRAFT_820842 [Thozetella sp. PMI_491]|nr:hypothetical protein GQ53DRAFT_820842 [Thozetella sp. PMI_491]